MKKLSAIALTVAFMATTLFAYQVTFHYDTSKGRCSKDYTATVAPGETFTGSGQIPSGSVISGCEWVGKVEQNNHKNISLFVGIDEYDPEYGPGDLDTCENDASAMAHSLVDLGYFDGENATLLKSSEAKKSVIRSKITDAAKKLEDGDIFLYFHSSHGSDDPFLLCTYDDSYYATEFAEDLSQFKDGVIIIVMLDSCFSAGMVPSDAIATAVMTEMIKIKARKSQISAAKAAKDLKERSLFLTASQDYQYSYTFDMLSLFTNGLALGFDSLSDTDNDGIISFTELFNRAVAFVDIYGWQNPFISNPSIGNNLFAAPVPQPNAYGCLDIKSDNFTYTFPNVHQDLEIWVYAGAKPNLQTVINTLSFKVNLNKSGYDPLFPTKCTLDFTLKHSKKRRLAQKASLATFNPTIWINDHCIVLGQANQEESLGQNSSFVSYEVFDYNFTSIGKIQMKINDKKGEVRYKLKLDSVDDTWEVFKPMNEARQNLTLTIISNSDVISAPFTVLKKYKPRKALSASFVKSKK